MPDFNGILSPEDREKIHAWYKEKCTNTACPVCKNRNWVLADHIIVPMIYSGIGMTMEATGYPQIMIVCQNCSLTLFFNAAKLGLIGGQSLG